MEDKMDEIRELAEILRKSENIVFFGGAGVSTESGIPDFRSADGLWNEKLKIKCTPEQLVSHTFYMRFPEEFFEFYKSKLIYPKAEPNDAHKALAKLEEMGKLKAVVTQNIHGLHHAAGSTPVSLVVYPAAGLVEYFRGDNLVLINKSVTSADRNADLVIHDSIGKVLSEAMQYIISI